VAGALAAGVLAVAAPSAWAQAQSATASAAQEGQGSSSSSSSQWGLGVGVGVTERAYLGADRKVSGLPLIFYENTWVRVAGTTVEAKLLNHAFTSNQRVTGGLLLKYVGDGYKASDSSALAGMAERKGGLMGGAGLTWHNPIAKLSMEWTTDLSDHSKGQRLQVQADRRFQFGLASITPRLGAQWMDRKWVDYYYGVRASEATVNRAAYQADAGVALEAGVRVDYAIQKQHVIFLDLGVTHLPKEATNSPIVDRSNLPRAAVGYLYRF
jgi:MipA family protein